MASVMKMNKKGMLLAAIGDEDTCTGDTQPPLLPAAPCALCIRCGRWPLVW